MYLGRPSQHQELHCQHQYVHVRTSTGLDLYWCLCSCSYINAPTPDAVYSSRLGPDHAVLPMRRVRLASVAPQGSSTPHAMAMHTKCA